LLLNRLRQLQTEPVLFSFHLLLNHQVNLMLWKKIVPVLLVRPEMKVVFLPVETLSRAAVRLLSSAAVDCVCHRFI
jgi:hypothetical protein